jgi:PleD family two-component response regulator
LKHKRNQIHDQIQYRNLSMTKARILIVEDEAIIAMELESSLQSLGYEVTSIVDIGEKAISFQSAYPGE